jgi:hypothetical protein
MAVARWRLMARRDAGMPYPAFAGRREMAGWDLLVAVPFNAFLLVDLHRSIFTFNEYPSLGTAGEEDRYNNSNKDFQV